MCADWAVARLRARSGPLAVRGAHLRGRSHTAKPPATPSNRLPTAPAASGCATNTHACSWLPARALRSRARLVWQLARCSIQAGSTCCHERACDRCQQSCKLYELAHEPAKTAGAQTAVWDAGAVPPPPNAPPPMLPQNCEILAGSPGAAPSAAPALNSSEEVAGEAQPASPTLTTQATCQARTPRGVQG